MNTALESCRVGYKCLVVIMSTYLINVVTRREETRGM